MAVMPDSESNVDSRPATVLVRDFPHACAALATSALNLGGRTVLPWDEFTARAATAAAQETADQIYRAVARGTRGGQPGLGTVLDLSAAGRLSTVGGLLTKDPEQALEVLVSAAAVRSGAARWQHSRAGPAKLTRLDGSPIDLDGIVHLALAPEGVSKARERLAELGIDIADAAMVQARATAKGGEILGALANMKVDDIPHDVFILDNGLIVIPCPKKSDGGKQRLLALAQSRSVEQLASGNRFLAYEDVASVTVAKAVPVKVEVGLHAGVKITLQETWGGESIGSDDRERLVAGLRSQLAPTADAT
jgi:hypothetical protein